MFLNSNLCQKTQSTVAFFNPEMSNYFKNYCCLVLWKIPPLSIHILPHPEKSEINLNLIDDASSVDIAPLTLSVPTVCFDLTKFKKRYNQPGNIETVLFTTYFRISFNGKKFTDGSKTEAGVIAAAVSTKCSRNPLTCCLPTTAPYTLQNYEQFFWL